MRFKFNKQNSSILFSLLIITATSIIRFCWLGSDPPLYFTNMGQALLTDPYNVICHARSKILFDKWDIFDFDRWIVFKYSLSSMFCYVVFLIGGVSRITANLSAGILSLGGIGLFIYSFKNISRQALTIVSLLLLTNMTLIVYGRYPFLENGLILLCGLLYFISVHFHERRWMPATAGLVTALCIISGKLFGVVMLVPVILFILTDKRSLIAARLTSYLGSFAGFTILSMFLFYGGSIGNVFSYVSEQTIGMYGVPDAAISPLAFFEKLISFGGESRLFYFAPFFMLLLILGLAGILTRKDTLDFLKSNKPLLFNLGWFLAGFFLLMIVNYRPLRYQLFLLLPAAGIISILFTESKAAIIDKKFGILKSVLLFITIWYCAGQLGYIISYILDYGSASTNIAWYALMPAVPLFLFVLYFKNILTGLIRYRQAILIVLLSFSVVIQSVWIVRWYNSKTYLLKEAGEDLNQVVDKDAVICGPFAQALTIDNRLKSLIYMFGLTRKETDLFSRFPITHLAVDISNWRQAQKDFAILKDSYKLSDYWLRDIKIDLISVAQSLSARAGINYNMTDYERAGRYHSAARYPDSVFLYLRQFLTERPRSKAGLRLLSNYYLSAGAVDQGFKVFDRLISFYPDDFSLYFENARAYYLFHLNTGNQEYLKQSDKYFSLALNRNKFLESDIKAARESLRSLAK